jgi:hypothetical protein
VPEHADSQIRRNGAKLLVFGRVSPRTHRAESSMSPFPSAPLDPTLHSLPEVRRKAAAD